MIFPPIIFQLFFPFLRRSIAFLVPFAFSKQAVLAVTICSPDPGCPYSSAPAPPDWRCSCLHWHTASSPFSKWTSAGLRTLWSHRVCGQQSGTEQSISDIPAMVYGGLCTSGGWEASYFCGLPLDSSHRKQFRKIWEVFLRSYFCGPKSLEIMGRRWMCIGLV